MFWMYPGVGKVEVLRLSFGFSLRWRCWGLGMRLVDVNVARHWCDTGCLGP